MSLMIDGLSVISIIQGGSSVPTLGLVDFDLVVPLSAELCEGSWNEAEFSWQNSEIQVNKN